MIHRAFAVGCDSCGATCEASTSTSAVDAGRIARAGGWHMSGNYAICATCWDSGVRMGGVR